MRRLIFSSFCRATLLVSVTCLAQTPPSGVRDGQLPERWITGGPNCMEVPDWQIQQHNEDLFILRESGCTDYEKPFLYLFFGTERALLEDTGSGPAETGKAVQGVIARWLERHQRQLIPLVVAHSHSHDDHTAGDGQFRAMKGVTMVPLTVEGTQAFFGIRRWPDDIGQIDLGSRILDVIPIPGHDPLSIAFYDDGKQRTLESSRHRQKPMSRSQSSAWAAALLSFAIIASAPKPSRCDTFIAVV